MLRGGLGRLVIYTLGLSGEAWEAWGMLGNASGRLGVNHKSAYFFTEQTSEIIEFFMKKQRSRARARAGARVDVTMYVQNRGSGSFARIF